MMLTELISFFKQNYLHEGSYFMMSTQFLPERVSVTNCHGWEIQRTLIIIVHINIEWIRDQLDHIF